jgi:LysR family carnitine catabolism transcriptional activator
MADAWVSMNINVRQLQAFLEIARLQSFTKAAERIHISQAGLSMMIKELEDQVGSRLFERTTRSVTLSDAGRRLQPVAARVVEELESVASALGEIDAKAVSTLRVAATPLVSASLLPSVFQGFKASHPEVAIKLVDAEIGEVRRRVLEGEADLGLGFFFKPAVGMVRAPLFRFQLMRVSPATSARPAGLGGGVPWTSLRTAKLISLPPENPIQTLIETHLKPLGRAHEERSVFNLFGTIISMVEADLGTAVIPSFALAECLRHQVRVEMLVKPTAHIDLYLASRRGVSTKPVAAEFAAALQRAIPSLVMHD